MNSQDTLTIQFHSEDQILVILSYYKKERKFYLPLTETEHILEADKVSYGKMNACTQQGTQFSLSFEDFTTIMKDAIVISDNVDVFFEKSQIRFWNEDEKGHNYQFRLDEFIEHEEFDNSFIAGYNMQKLLNYCKNPINTHVNCNLGIHGPAKLSHDDSKQSNL